MTAPDYTSSHGIGLYHGGLSHSLHQNARWNVSRSVATRQDRSTTQVTQIKTKGSKHVRMPSHAHNGFEARVRVTRRRL
jgi:hypothetical protein